jgi:hypothetical protein
LNCGGKKEVRGYEMIPFCDVEVVATILGDNPLKY